MNGKSQGGKEGALDGMRVSTKKIRYDDRLGSLLNVNGRTKKEPQLQSSKRITPIIQEEHG